MRIWQAKVVAQSDHTVDVKPGSVIAESVEGIDVVTGEGVLTITRLQLESKRQMSAADFLNANSLLGQVLL